MTNTQKKKRFYKKDEYIWIIPLKKVGQIQEINTKDVEATVVYETDGHNGAVIISTSKFKMYEIDKLRGEKASLNVKPKQERKKDEILWAKIHPKAIIPSKRKEDAGRDIYACFGESEIHIPHLTPTLISTGLAVSVKDKYYVNFKHERGSTGIHGMAILSGVVDSGYRDELFINITPLHCDIVISKKVDKAVTKYVDGVKTVYFPYDKAIAQATIDIVPDLEDVEVPYEELLKIKSERGLGKLGSSNK